MPPEVEPNFLLTVQTYAHDLLVWIGFGTVVGLVARTLMPGRETGGAIGTLMMGIGGVVIGCGSLSYFSPGIHISPVSPLGFFAATGGAFTILFFYQLLSNGGLDGQVQRPRSGQYPTSTHQNSGTFSGGYQTAHTTPRPAAPRRSPTRSTTRSSGYSHYDY